MAWRSFFLEICGLDLGDEITGKAAAYRDANGAGWWWPHTDFVVVSERQTELHREQVGPTGWGSHRLHREDGPAIRWGDEWELHFWHGTQVPAWVCGADGGPTVEKIWAEQNAEVRRCAIEAFGWPDFIDAANLALVDECEDPGNPGQTLALYDVPEQLYEEPVRVLLCTNGTQERDGTRHRFGLTTPADQATALAAAAWTFGMTESEYAGCARRT
jgi:hypothetical protein